MLKGLVVLYPDNVPIFTKIGAYEYFYKNGKICCPVGCFMRVFGLNTRNEYDCSEIPEIYRKCFEVYTNYDPHTYLTEDMNDDLLAQYCRVYGLNLQYCRVFLVNAVFCYLGYTSGQDQFVLKFVDRVLNDRDKRN